MATVGSLVINLLGNHKGLSSSLNDAKVMLDGFKTAASAAIVGVAAAGAAWAVKMAAEVETLAMSFETLTGTIEGAKSMMADLRGFATMTPFNFGEVANGARKMLALGFSAQQVLPILNTVGDAVASVGGSTETFGRVILALSQIQSKGKLMTQEMNQLAETGIAAWTLLSDGMGISVAEAMDRTGKGMISSAEAMKHIFAGMAKTSGGAMAKMADTISGKWNTLVESISSVLTDIGAEFGPMIKGAIDWGKALVPVAAAIGAVALASVALTLATKAYAQAQILTLALQGPKGWIQLAAGIGIAAGAYMIVARSMSKVNAEMEAAKKKLEDAQKGGSGVVAVVKIDPGKEARGEFENARRNAGFARQQEAFTTWRNEVSSLNDELGKLSGTLTDNDIKLRDLAAQGLNSQQLDRVRELMKLVDEQKARTKAQEDAERLVNDQRQRGLALMEQYASPAEKALKKAQELQELLNAGAIDKATFDKATADNNQSDQKSPQGTKALAAGSSESWSAFLQFQRGAAKDKALDESKIHTKQNDRQTAVLTSIDRKLGKEKTPVKI